MAESYKPGAREPLEQQTISEREKPGLDEATFQQLLGAAHVLQEQKAFEVANRPKPKPAEALAEIVETQEFLRSQPSDLQLAGNLIVERLQRITHATGVAVAVVRENHLEYCAAAGDAANLAGSSLPMDSSMSADGRLSTEFSREPTNKHSIALPLHHEGNLAGLLEVRFADTESIEEPEMRSCQLMAGLMTEAIARAADKQWRQTLAAERAAMLEALERIKPQLERLAVTPANNATQPALSPAVERFVEPAARTESGIVLPPRASGTKPGSDPICSECGHRFAEPELFCGRCGTARPQETSSALDLHSKRSSLWHHPPSAENKNTPREEAETRHDEIEISPLAETKPGFSHEPAPELAQETSSPHDQGDEAVAALEGDSGLVTSDAAPEGRALVTKADEVAKSSKPWGSAAHTQEWLESLHPKSATGIWLAKHRADIYVGAAVVLLLIVLSSWGAHPAESHLQPKGPPQPSLTLFDKLLVSLGLAETPPAPVYLGNPNARVWVDRHTALYYCPGAELYGKTAGGKFTTQRDAQLDQFEPAARKNCD